MKAENKLNERLARLQWSLKERVKELECLYGIGLILEKPDITLDEIYKQVAELLPAAWQYPEITCVQLTINGKEFKTANYRETKWKQSSDIIVHNTKAGTLSVVYLEEKPVFDEGPFLKEEKLLIDAVAERLGKVIERKRIEVALARSESVYRDTLDNSSIGLFHSTEHGKFLFINPSLARMLGYETPSEIIAYVNKTNIAEALYVNPPKRGQLVEQAKNKGGWIYAENEYRKKDGSIIIGGLTVQAILKPDGAIDYIQGILEDVTERKRVEEALKKSDERLRAIVMNAHIGIVTSGMDRYFLSANDAFCRILGYTEAELQKMSFKDITHPEDIKVSIAMVDDIDAGKITSFDQEKRYIKKDGKVITGKVMVSVVRDHEGKPYLYIAELEDITERKKAEETVRQSEKKFATLMEKSTDGVIILGDGLVKYVNPKGLEMVGFSREDVLGKPFIDFVSPEYHEQVMERYRRRLIGEEVPNVYEIVLLHKDGHVVSVEVNANLIDYDGRPATLAMVRDITERKKVEEKIRNSERMLKKSQSLGRIGSWDYDVQKQTVVWSDETYRLYERDLELPPPSSEEEGQYYSPEQRKLLLDYASMAIETGQTFVYDFKLILTSGKKMDYHSVMQPVKDEQGKVVRLSGTVQDITERKKSEEILRMHSELLDMERDSVYLHDFEGNLIYFNKATCTVHGYTREELLNMKLSDLDDPVSAKLIPLRKKEIMERGQATFEVRHRHKDGSLIPLEIHVSIIELNGQKLIMSVARDITERKRAEELLRESETIFSNFMANSPIYVFFKDEKMRSLRLSNNYETMLGKPLAELLGKSMFDLFPSKVAKSMVADDIRTMEEGMPITVEEELNGRLYLTTKFPIFAEGKPMYLAGYTIDVTERKQSEKALTESEKRYRTLFEEASEGIIIADRETMRFKYANPAICQMLGYTLEEMTQMGVADIHPEGSMEVIRANFEAQSRGEKILTPGIPSLKKDGTTVYMDISAAKTIIDGRDCNVGFFTDITERKLWEEEHQKAAKLDSIGTLAGGIAHDFNNILTAILGNIQLAEGYLGKGKTDTALELLGDAEKASFRAKSLTQQLLTFSRGGSPVKKPMHIDKLIKESATFVLRGTGCKPEFAIARDLWAVEADEGQLGQVLSNLVINASQAMPNGGRIYISASNVVTGKQPALFLPKGRYVEIDVKDQGIGIPEGNKSKIFDPYFTTKQKGSGLGLASSYSIIKNHGGIITFESTLGVGTTFHVYLPATMDKIEEKKGQPAAAAQTSPVAQGRILVMDDEESIRKLLGRMLQSAGYEVELTADGAEAIKKYTEARGSGKPYDVVILDLTVPGGIGGREVLAKLLEIDPGVKAIVSSGYANDPIMANYKKYGFSGVVSKPYNLAQMQETLRNILAGK